MSNSNGVYAVKKGMVPGIYNDWNSCRFQVENYSGAEFKKFATMEEAIAYMDETKTVTLLSKKNVAFKTMENISHLETEVNDNTVPLESDNAVPLRSDNTVPLKSDNPYGLSLGSDNPYGLSFGSDNTVPALSLEQEYAYNMSQLGHNLFITGPGGTGKSYLIKKICERMDAKSQPYAVCALTGCAAVLLNCCAKTIHSWGGIGIASGTIEEITDKVMKNKRALARWRSIKTLIIDEISMMSLKIFNLLDRIAKAARRMIHLPFGGLQVIFLGDFYQLPPVSRNAATEPDTQRFCFESLNWNTTFPAHSCVQLATLFRQRDPIFIEVLKDARRGVLTENTCNILRSRMIKPPSDLMPTQLFPRNADADKVNKAKYAEIKEPEIVFTMSKFKNLRIYVENQKPIPTDILRRCEMLTDEEAELQLDMYIENNNLEKTLALKMGALVMCLANLDVEAGICNGSQGVIIDFKPVLHPVTMLEIRCPVVRFHNGHTRTIEPKVYQHGDYPKFGCEQLPLRLAWAFTIHKAQGITLDVAEIDIGSRIFEFGQTYVALSRVRSLDGLYLTGFNPKRIKTSSIVIEFYDRLPDVTENMVEQSREHLVQIPVLQPKHHFRVEKLGSMLG